MTVLPSDRVAICGVVDPDANAAAAYTTDWLDMTEFQQAMAICLAGALGTSATVDFKVQQATDSSGTGAKNITGKSATQLTDAGSDSDKQVIINVNADDLDIAGGFTHVAAVMTVAVATSDCAALILGLDPRHGPASANDLASVDEIV